MSEKIDPIAALTITVQKQLMEIVSLKNNYAKQAVTIAELNGKNNQLKADLATANKENSKLTTTNMQITKDLKEANSEITKFNEQLAQPKDVTDGKAAKGK
ncbi:MAG: septal ring factor EnvC (AmiA/AmiB activator) [Vicingaceae bacterium]|jgi:septal ring factor EnvC (AmiA/AmiB activator)